MSFTKHVSNTIKYPASARSNGIQGAVDMAFSVGYNGKITDIKIIRSIYPDVSEEVASVLESLPATIGQSLASETGSLRFVLPISFGLETPFRRTE